MTAAELIALLADAPPEATVSMCSRGDRQFSEPEDVEVCAYHNATADVSYDAVIWGT